MPLAPEETLWVSFALGRALAVGEDKGRAPRLPRGIDGGEETIASPGALLTGTFCREVTECFSPVKNNSPAAVVHPGSAVPVVSIDQRVSYPNDVIAVKS